MHHPFATLITGTLKPRYLVDVVIVCYSNIDFRRLAVCAPRLCLRFRYILPTLPRRRTGNAKSQFHDYKGPVQDRMQPKTDAGSLALAQLYVAIFPNVYNDTGTTTFAIAAFAVLAIIR